MAEVAGVGDCTLGRGTGSHECTLHLPVEQADGWRDAVFAARDAAGNVGVYTTTFLVDTTLTLSEYTPYAHVSGDTLYYAENSGSFTVTAALTDTLARLADVTFPDTTSTGISYALSGATTATRSRTYTFTEEVNEEGVYQVAASDRATNVGTSPLTVTRDTTPPTFTLSPAVENGALRVTWSTLDAASGVDAGTCELHVQEDEGTWQPFSTACAGDGVHFKVLLAGG